MRKKISWIAVLAILLAMIPLSGGVFAQSDISIEIDGQNLALDVAPVVEAGRVLLPIAHLFRDLGATVTWNEDNRTVTIQQEGTTILLTIDNQIAIVNGMSVQMDAPARILNARTILPLRFVAENLGADVHWDEINRVVHVTTADGGFEPRPISFEVVPEAEWDTALAEWAETNQMTKGIHFFSNGDAWIYVMAAGGERPTGGFNMTVLTVTETHPGEAFVEGELEMPAPEEMVTQALTYPYEVIRFSASGIDEVTGEIRELHPAMQEVTLYFMHETTTAFQTEGEARLLQQDQVTAENLLNELLAGPQTATLSPVIPEEATVLNVTVADGLATVDFSAELAEVNYGAETENVLVTSIVWTLVQLADVDAVQIMVEGEIIESLAGHVSINEPLTRE